MAQSYYDAPILSASLSLTSTPTVVSINNVNYNYVEFLFDNRGDEDILITMAGATIRLTSGTYIVLIQEKVNSISVATEAGKTSTLFYTIQGYRR